jgi:Alpha-glucosidases, family 31 of glycosyl hydrolases
MTFSRSGFEGSQAHPAHWAGDERSTFEAFRASVRAGINAGLSGLPFWGWDFAGFSGDVPSAELYLRAASMAALCPIMQYHAESRGEECRDRTPWNIASRCGDPSVIDYYRDLARLRMNLIPYLWAEAERGSRTGAPMMRALFAEYPGEAWLGQVDDEYLLGPSILVAPIVHEGASSREVALPPGGWTPLLGGGRIEGGRILDMAAPLRSPLCGTVALLRDDHVVSLNLPADFAFPGDVGNSVDGYTRLCFLASARAGFEYEYERYDGARVELAAKTASGVCVVEAENGGEEPVWVALGEHRRFLEAPPGRSTLEFPVEW